MLHHMLRAAAQRAFNVLDPYFQYVTMLLHGDGTNGAQNNTFLDSSTNNFTITRNGNTTQGTFTPYGSNWSNYLNGSTDYLSTASNSALAVGTGAFTAEAWIYPNTINNYAQIIGQTVNSNSYWMFCLQSNGAIRQQNYTVVQISSPSGAVVVGQWQHVVLVRDASSNIAIFVNGTRVANGTDSTNWSTNSVNTIGASTPDSGYHNGYISNARLVKGTAVYNPTSTTLTVPTTPLTAITNTSLLTCQSNRFIDNSTNAYTITVNSTPSIQRFSPFSPTTAYSTSVIGGSGYFDGSGDYLTAGSSISLSGDFTVEAWYYPTSSSGNGYYMFGLGNDFLSTGATFFITTTGYLRIYTGNSNILSGTSGAAQLNTWNHIAFVRSGTTVKAYLNGVQVDSATFTSSLSGTAYINAELNGNPTANIYVGSAGYYSNHRVGTTAVYTAAFTPSTTPLTAITGTSLLLSYTNAGILDNAMMNDLETVGNAQISTSVKKYGTGSMYFDGTGDGLYRPSSDLFNFGSGSFTIEFWMYLSSKTGYQTLVSYGYSPQATTGWLVQTGNGDGKPVFYKITTSTATAVATDAGSTVNTGQWYHIAIVKNGSTTTIYRDGTSVGSGSDTNTYSVTGNFYIGGGSGTGFDNFYLNGYIDDLRITKGVARYTANFTPPTAAFPNN